MSISITWHITKLYVQKKTSEHTNLVFAADWECTATDGTYTSKQSGYCETPFTRGYVPYESLTEEQVLGWCWNCGVNREKIEADLTAEVEYQANPPIITPPLPWA